MTNDEYFDTIPLGGIITVGGKSYKKILSVSPFCAKLEESLLCESSFRAIPTCEVFQWHSDCDDPIKGIRKMMKITQEVVNNYLMMAQYILPIAKTMASWTEMKWDDNAVMQIESIVKAATLVNVDTHFANLIDKIANIFNMPPDQVQAKMQEATKALQGVGL